MIREKDGIIFEVAGFISGFPPMDKKHPSECLVIAEALYDVGLLAGSEPKAQGEKQEKCKHDWHLQRLYSGGPYDDIKSCSKCGKIKDDTKEKPCEECNERGYFYVKACDDVYGRDRDTQSIPCNERWRRVSCFVCEGTGKEV